MLTDADHYPDSIQVIAGPELDLDGDQSRFIAVTEPGNLWAVGQQQKPAVQGFNMLQVWDHSRSGFSKGTSCGLS